MFEIKNKVAIVTGAASGIGLQITKQLLKNNAKFVMMTDIDEIRGVQECNKLKKIYGFKTVDFQTLDVLKTEDFKGVFLNITKNHDRVDILINNAGITASNAQTIQRMIDINFTASAQALKLGLKFISKNDAGGTILNITSVRSITPGPLGTAWYTATKHAIFGFIKTHSTKSCYEQYGVRILTLCPGFTDTALVAPMKDHLEKSGIHVQPVENVGDAAIMILREAEHGSVWVSENNLPAYEIHVETDHSKLRKTEIYESKL